MSASRFGRLQKATTLVPLTLLSCAWTASLAGVGGVGVTNASADEKATTSLPDGTSVPTEAIEAPASVSVPGEVAPGISGDTQTVVANSSTSGIPSAALSAYQRAETIINAADKSCQLPWQLVAAIGRVESDHGRTNGNQLDDKGVARPGIYGIALNGKNNTQAIADTDAGQYDADSKYDRAVGPMQFIPSTWSVVGVDADGDAQRNPQDIDDAALATAVYLCSGNDDLSTEAGQRSSVYRYNHSQSYVSLVLSIMNAYMDGDFTSVPNSTTSAGYFVPDPNAPTQPVKNHHGNGNGNNTPGTGASQPSQPQPTEPAPSDPTTPPAPNPTNPGGNNPVPVPTPTLPPVPTPTVPPVDEVLTLAQAIAQCTTEGYVDNPLVDNDDFDKCVAGYTKK
ncbi:lytic transglycosylase domain-containing protein [Nocardioides sp. KIGAM211]|uniref:Lytic transglycosylase domain-containing protein n=1 Tax=Nocardioides luti TaxID=2761101 RepID=A0A7X0VBP5_9ACTN|nr:lytic transglycosylase domain-containing protein [Nocardioides luti]MBB6627388.1 lytic transglycosylase domain-containing protein [Nocardioides luti]